MTAEDSCTPNSLVIRSCGHTELVPRAFSQSPPQPCGECMRMAIRAIGAAGTSASAAQGALASLSAAFAAIPETMQIDGSGILRLKDGGFPVWRSKNGKLVRVSSMASEHLLNTLCMLRRERLTTSAPQDLTDACWERILQGEAVGRGLDLCCRFLSLGAPCGKEIAGVFSGRGYCLSHWGALTGNPVPRDPAIPEPVRLPPSPIALARFSSISTSDED